MLETRYEEGSEDQNQGILNWLRQIDLKEFRTNSEYRQQVIAVVALVGASCGAAAIYLGTHLPQILGLN